MNPDKIRSVLNAIFLVGALASIVVYFAVEDKKVFFYVCGITLCVKLMEFFVRFTNR